MEDDLFEFEAVPKFIDFQNENDDFEKSAFFKGDVVLQPTPQVNSRLLPSQQIQALPETSPKKTEPASSSNLALFNPSASRVAEKIRRRSEQRQAQPETASKESKPRSSSIRRNASAAENAPLPSQQIQAPPETAPEESKPRSSSIRRNASAAENARLPSQPIQARPHTPPKKTEPASSSNLALFNPSASRVAEKIRRRSQQGQAQPEPASKESKPRSSFIQRNASAAENARLPPLRPQTRSQTASTETLTNRKAAPFTQTLRSYKAPTGSTPAKPLTIPTDVPLRRSTSRCRDTKPDMDPRIRASIDRLSAPRTPRKRESQVNVAVKASSNLALFNPGASRVAEQIRRRSQLRQAPPETASKESKPRSSSIQRNASATENGRLASQKPQTRSHAASTETITNRKEAPFTQTLRSYKAPTGSTPAKPLTIPVEFPLRRSSSRCRDTKPDMDPRIRATVDRLSTPRRR